MKAIIFGKNKDKISELVIKYGFTIVEKDPDFIISYGGDGTIMHAEYAFPEIPKIILRDSYVCKLCSKLSNEEVLDSVSKNKYKIEKLWKLEVASSGKTLYAVNDVILHNADPRHAIRYEIMVDENRIGSEIIGDGIVIATPFGSTGYYRSITDSYFEIGIGLAFNNSTEPSDHVVLDESRSVKIKITRGPALIYADNQEDKIDLKEGDSAIIRKSNKFANIIKI